MREFAGSLSSETVCCDHKLPDVAISQLAYRIATRRAEMRIG
jgi:hypothetical protein